MLATPDHTSVQYTTQSYYWPSVDGEIHDYAANCSSFTQIEETHYKSRRELRLFLATEPLSLVTQDFLGPLSKFNSCSKPILIITDRFTKFTREIPLKYTSSQVVTDTFLLYCAYAYGLSDFLLSDNIPEFAAWYLQHALVSLCY